MDKTGQVSTGDLGIPSGVSMSDNRTIAGMIGVRELDDSAQYDEECYCLGAAPQDANTCGDRVKIES